MRSFSDAGDDGVSSLLFGTTKFTALGSQISFWKKEVSKTDLLFLLSLEIVSWYDL